MPKTILITGSTDGIGLVAARKLAEAGHTILLHGRTPTKLARVKAELAGSTSQDRVFGYIADLSLMANVKQLAAQIREAHPRVDVLINNAGVYRIGARTTEEGIDVRFAVNTFAPYLLAKLLMDIIPADGRVVNLSSAAQAAVDVRGFTGAVHYADGNAYAQSKLALTMWTSTLARRVGDDGPLVVSVNPGSMLATKMVKEAYGVHGADINIGANILVRAALSEDFEGRSGQYFDNDRRRFAPPPPAAQDPTRCAEITASIDTILNDLP